MGYFQEIDGIRTVPPLSQTAARDSSSLPLNTNSINSEDVQEASPCEPNTSQPLQFDFSAGAALEFTMKQRRAEIARAERAPSAPPQMRYRSDDCTSPSHFARSFRTNIAPLRATRAATVDRTIMSPETTKEFDGNISNPTKRTQRKSPPQWTNYGSAVKT